MRLPGVEAIAKRFADATLTVELTMPDEATLALLTDPDKVLDAAKEFVVDSDDNYKAAKLAADALKDESDFIEASRKKGGGGLNTLKTAWDSLFNPAKKTRDNAAGIYHQKMRAYETKKRGEDEKSRKQQEVLANEQKQKLLQDAAKQKARAAKLINPGKKREALELAERLEVAAETTPTQFAASTTSVPSLGSGSKSERWHGSVDAGGEDGFIYWLWQNPTWRSLIVQYAQSGLNDLAKSVKDNTKIPGFTATAPSSYRRDPKRKKPV